MFNQLDDLLMYYVDKGTGPALVFIHGLGEDSSSWSRQLNFFQTSFRVIAMDLRGHGQSSDGEHPITMAQFASDMIALLDALNISQAHFVGHSMGGLICQELALHYHSRMLTMTLSDAAGYYPPPFSTTILDKWLKRIDALPFQAMAEDTVRLACHPDTPAALKEEMKQVFLQNRRLPYRQATEATIKSDYRPYHAQMKLPTLILVGAEDQVTPYEYSVLLNRSIANSKLQVISGSAHMSKFENPSAYNQALAEFLTPYAPEATLPLLKTAKS